MNWGRTSVVIPVEKGLSSLTNAAEIYWAMLAFSKVYAKNSWLFLSYGRQGNKRITPCYNINNFLTNYSIFIEIIVLVCGMNVKYHFNRGGGIG